MMDDLGLEDVSFDESLTQPGQIIGSTPYKAPDSARVGAKQFTCVMHVCEQLDQSRYVKRTISKILQIIGQIFGVGRGPIYLMHLFGVNP